jgi:hypothetical protein
MIQPTISSFRNKRSGRRVRRAFRRLVLADPILVELRKWSRIADDLTAEKNRLANLVREQLWRYYPQMLEVESNVATGLLLALWEAVSTPAKAARLQETMAARLQKEHRIRRIDAAGVLAILRPPPCPPQPDRRR